METFVLTHGAWHGSWCWNKVVPLLEKKGYKVITPDLPGHGNNKISTKDITMQSYTDCVCKILDNESEPVSLLGHSMGGVRNKSSSRISTRKGETACLSGSLYAGKQ